MKLCYALRRGVFYPSQRDVFGEVPPRDCRSAYLEAVRGLGFDGIEVPAWLVDDHLTGHPDPASDVAIREFRAEVEGAGLTIACVRGGGPVSDPRLGPATLARLHQVVHFTAIAGASVINVTCGSAVTDPRGPGALRIGEPVAQGSSRGCSEADFERTARHFREITSRAADLGLEVAIEVHQGSLADNSWSALHLADLVDLPSFGVNPDLGNIYWQYDQPEETSEAAIIALAPRAKYWHCKNLRRILFPELRHAIFQRVPLPEGDIDYRFAIGAMLAAGYTGYAAIEGVNIGDQLTQDGRSAKYFHDMLGAYAKETQSASDVKRDAGKAPEHGVAR